MRPRGYYTYTYSVVPSTTTVVRWLLILNVCVFLLQRIFLDRYLKVFGLVPSWFLARGFLWQIATYMFLHGGLMHIFFNMLFLWMMGSELERYWGSKEFLKYYFVTGIGAGLVNAVAQPRSGIPIIGASGAIFGLIIAFALAFPEREILLYFFIRMKAKYFALLVAAIEVIALLALPGSGIARLAHLGGLVVGYFYLKRETLSYSLRKKTRAWQRRLGEAEERRKDAERARRDIEVDRILDKINREGIESLSEKEKRFLERQGKGRF